MTRKPKRRKKKDRERRADKRRAKPTAQSASIQEYYQLAFLHYATELQDRYSPEPWPGRSAFWRTIPGGVYQAENAREYLNDYLRRIEDALQAAVSGNSLAYW